MEKGQYDVGTDAALVAIMSGENVFVSGPGGTGKTYLINMIQSMYGDSCITVAPTGVAALNVNGATAHRTFDLAAGVSMESDWTAIRAKTAKPLKSKAFTILIIDEISMIRADKFIEMDRKLRFLRKNDKPFGGIQVLLFGDFYQAPPVVSSMEKEAYFNFYHTDLCCYTESWEDLNLHNIALVDQFRQESVRFATMLNCVREGRRIKEVVAELNTRCYHGGVPTDALTICATNKQAEEVNRRFYDAIKAPEKTYIGKMKGKFPSTLPVEQEMRLKIGMKVMITSNDVDPTHKVPYYVNGTRATVVKFKTKSVVVELEDGAQVEIEPRLWENNEYKPSQRYNIAERKMEKFIERVVIGSYEQLPLKSWYAVTSHKSQGLTLDCYNLDLGKNGAFSPGMTYVALSRVKTIQGINLLRPLREVDIIVDPRVVEFYNTTFPGLDEKVRKDFETRVEKGDV
ncbi:helicase [Escherichia phage vB_EcoM_SYGMH1]|uniref:Helicase n=1 Tax=Escherichia phage vB_EcoM_SYGMH1 TaxID=2829846 RepID=A0A8T8IWU2_9CAUD|nr:helicase [Escherichia phage vB_EcoM_SYGMH1]